MESDIDPIRDLAIAAGAHQNIEEPFAYCLTVIAERDALRKQLATLRDGPSGTCRDSGIRLDVPSVDRMFGAVTPETLR